MNAKSSTNCTGIDLVTAIYDTVEGTPINVSGYAGLHNPTDPGRSYVVVHLRSNRFRVHVKIGLLDQALVQLSIYADPGEALHPMLTRSRDLSIEAHFSNRDLAWLSKFLEDAVHITSLNLATVPAPTETN